MVNPARGTQDHIRPDLIEYCFTIQDVKESLVSENVPARCDQYGNWLPPRRKGCNVLRRPHERKQWWHVAPRGLVPIPPTYDPTPELEHFRTYTLYHSDGVIHMVPFDATRYQVGDGTHSEYDEQPEADSDEEDDDPEVPVDDWQELRFTELPKRAGVTSISYAHANGDETKVRAYSERQWDWISTILPPKYQHRQNREDYESNHGGLCGPLALLIGLVALALTEQQTDDGVTATIDHLRWKCDFDPIRVERRGVLVQTYSKLLGSADPSGRGGRINNSGYLTEFERGTLGPILW